MRLIILSSKTGGGHEMRAQSILDFCNSLEIEAKILRPLEDGSLIYFFGTKIYNWIQCFYPKLHCFYFRFLEYASMHSSSKKILGKKNFQDQIKSFAPNAVISVHAHLNHGFWDLILDMYDKVPPRFMIYSGELDDGFGFSKHWVNPNADLFCGPSEKTIAAAIQRGMPSYKCKVIGPLLRKPFYQDPDFKKRNSFLKDFGLNQALPIGLLATGANGVNSHEMALQAISRSGINYQVVVLCGKSHKLFEKINLISERYNFPIRTVYQLNADDMCTLMHLSKWVFGRPGAGLTTEALATGTNIIFDVSKGIMPQEQNNLNYFTNNGQALRVASKAEQLSMHLKREFNKSSFEIKLNSKLIQKTILSLVNE